MMGDVLVKLRLGLLSKKRHLKRRELITGTLDSKLRKKLLNCYMKNIALYGAETWTLRAVDQKHLDSSEMRCWRRMEEVSWTDNVRNGEVLLRVKEQRNILHEIINGRLTGLVTFCVETVFYNRLLRER
jgi:hypothetical protein